MMEKSAVSSESGTIIRSRVKKKATIAMLVIRRKWSLLEKLMRCDSFDIPFDDSLSIFVRNSISEDLIVHFICRFQPLSTL